MGKSPGMGGQPRPKPIEFLPHALERLDRRDITADDVIEAVRYPEETGLPTQPGRQRVRRRARPGYAIDVVYEETDERIRVVTVFGKQLSIRRRGG